MLHHSLLRGCCAFVGCLLPLLVHTTHVFAASDTWDGGGADNNLSTNLNWADNTAPASDLVNTDIIFAGTARLTPNVSAAFSTHSVTFNNTAGAFTIGGIALSVGTGGIVNNDADTQSFNDQISFSGVATATINAASGGLNFNQLVTLPTGTLTVDGSFDTVFNNISGSSALTKQGAGTMTWSPITIQSFDLTISAGTLATVADGVTDLVNTTGSIAVTGTGVFNIGESLTLDNVPLTRASTASMTLAAGKTLTVQNGADVAITGTFLNNTGANTITITGAGSTLTTTSTLTLGGGNVTNVFAGGSIATGSGGVSIGTSGNGTATVDGSGSSFDGGALSVGLSGAAGSVTFRNSSTGSFGTMSVDNSSNATTSGTLNIQSGASVSGTSLLLAAQAVANIGTVTVTDAGSVFTVTGAGTATIGATSASTGQLNVQSGGTFNSGTGTITVNATGTVAINGGTFNANGNMNLNGQLTRDATGVFTLAAGKTLTVQNGGDVTITGAFSNDTASTITVTGGSSFTTTSTLSINGGSTMNVVGFGGVSTGGSSVQIGASGNGTVTVDGSLAFFGSGSVSVGLNANTGSLTFSNGCTVGLSTLSIANSGISGTNGTLNVQSAAVSGTGLTISATSAAESGTVTLSGFGSSLTINGTGTATVGASSLSTGQLNVQSGSTFTSGTGTIKVNKTGAIAINGGAFHANGNIIVQGTLFHDVGAVFSLATGKKITVNSGGHATFVGTDLILANSNCGLTVSDPGSTFHVAFFLNTSNSFDLNVTAGGSVSLGGINMGSGATADVLTVSGSGSTFSAIFDSAFGNASVTFNSASTGSFAILRVDPDQFGLSNTTCSFLVQGGADVTGGITAIGSTGNTGTSNASVFTVTGAGSTYSQTGGLAIGSSNIGTGIGTGTLNVANGGTYTSGTGTISLEKTGTINIDGGTLHLNGTLLRNGGVLNFNTGALSIVDDFTVGMGGLFGSDVTFDATRQFTTSATTTIDAFHTLTLNGTTFSTGVLVVNGTLAFNSGTLAITGAGGLTIGSGGPFASALTLGAGQTVNVTNTTTVNGGAVLLVENGGLMTSGTLANSGAVVLDGPTAALGGTAVNNSGLIRGEGSISANVTNTASGEIRAQAGKTLAFTGASGTNAGIINLQTGTAQFSQPLTNGAAGQIVGRGMLITGGVGLTNSGNIALSGGLTDIFGDVNNATGSATKGVTISGSAGVTFWGDVTNGAGSLFKVSSGSSATFFGTFGGGGISGAGQVNFEADVTPGFSPAAVTFGGNLTFESTSTLHIDIGGTTPGSGPNNHDQVNVAGTVALGGTLDLVPFGGFVPVAGDKFVVMTYASASGTFSTVTGTTPAPGLTYTPVYAPTNLTILTTTTGEKAWAVDASGNASLGANWTGGIAPGGVGDSATFSTIITAPRVVTIDADTTVGAFKFDSPIGYTIAGPHMLTLQATGSDTASINVLNAHGNGAHTISAPLVLASNLNVVQNSNGTLRLSGSLDDSTSRTITKSGTGTVEIAAAPTLGANAVINVNAGTLRFAASGGTPTIGTGVQVNVGGSATLELAGSASALASSTNRTDIGNSSAALTGLLVSGTNQIVGGIDGSGTTQVNAGSDLSANHIIQNALMISGTAGSPALVTIAASDASGNPLGRPSGFALAGSVTPNDPFGVGGIGSAILSSGDTLNLAALSTRILAAGGNPSAVPEPSTLLLVLVAVTGLVGQRFGLRLRARCNYY